MHFGFGEGLVIGYCFCWLVVVVIQFYEDWWPLIKKEANSSRLDVNDLDT